MNITYRNRRYRENVKHLLTFVGRVGPLLLYFERVSRGIIEYFDFIKCFVLVSHYYIKTSIE